MKATQVLFVLLIVLSAVAASRRATRMPKWHQLEGYTFEQYLVDHNKAYPEEELELRRSLFEKSLAAVRQHNDNPSVTYRRGMNHLSDWTPEEFRATLGYDKQLGKIQMSKRVNNPTVVDENLSTLPTRVDWRDAGVITDVKDQGRCGSCWTFGAAETIESHFAIQTGYLQDLSQQQIIDCVPNTLSCGGVGGCNGGTAELVFETLVSTVGGLASEWTYPYRSYFAEQQNYTCAYDPMRTKVAAHMTGHVVLPTNEYAPVMKTLANVGPLAVNVDASAWSSYESGVFSGCDVKENININHVVQLVGYGTDAKQGEYWLVRNSWGPRYGEQGYIRVARSSKVQCGTDSTPLEGTGCVGGPANQTVCGTCGILFDVSYPKIL